MKSTAIFHSFILSLFILCFSTTALALNPRDKFLYRLNVVTAHKESIVTRQHIDILGA
jgi:hypothetical protein